jgi:uncharacterized protein
MRRNTAIDRRAAVPKLKRHEAELKHLGVEHLYLFGSTARVRHARIPT